MGRLGRNAAVELDVVRRPDSSPSSTTGYGWTSHSAATGLRLKAALKLCLNTCNSTCSRGGRGYRSGLFTSWHSSRQRAMDWAMKRVKQTLSANECGPWRGKRGLK
eukprot:365718-Chlamydomonas_euryale.AAC.12